MLSQVNMRYQLALDQLKFSSFWFFIIMQYILENEEKNKPKIIQMWE